MGFATNLVFGIDAQRDGQAFCAVKKIGKSLVVEGIYSSNKVNFKELIKHIELLINEDLNRNNKELPGCYQEIEIYFICDTNINYLVDFESRINTGLFGANRNVTADTKIVKVRNLKDDLMLIANALNSDDDSICLGRPEYKNIIEAEIKKANYDSKIQSSKMIAFQLSIAELLLCMHESIYPDVSDIGDFFLPHEPLRS